MGDLNRSLNGSPVKSELENLRNLAKYGRFTKIHPSSRLNTGISMEYLDVLLPELSTDKLSLTDLPWKFLKLESKPPTLDTLLLQPPDLMLELQNLQSSINEDLLNQIKANNEATFLKNLLQGLMVNQIGNTINGLISNFKPNLNQNLGYNVGMGLAKQVAAVNPYAAAAVQAVDMSDKLITKRVEKFNTDTQLEAEQRGSYGGSYAVMDKASELTGKDFGWFSGMFTGDYGKAKKAKRLAEYLLYKISNINEKSKDWQALADDPTYDLIREVQLLGGPYDQRISAKHGAKLELIENTITEKFLNKVVKEVTLEGISKFQGGGTMQSPNEESEKEYVPEDIDKIIKFVNSHKKVNFVLRLKDSYRETIPDWEVEGRIATHKMGVEKDRGKIKVFPYVLEIDGELYDFTDPKYGHDEWDALESAEKNRDVIIFNNWDDALWFTKNYKKYYPTFDKYGSNNSDLKKTIIYDEDKDIYTFNFPPNHQRTLDELKWYNSNDPEAIQFRNDYEYVEGSEDKPSLYIRRQVDSFKEGGQFNVIPAGALHARLHHMENAENLTKKGIPVVSEKENGELEQQAEIELSEIIFRLSVTQKLEELLKKFYSDESSLKEKDALAIEAGKLLVDEILNNTIDNTGLLNGNE